MFVVGAILLILSIPSILSALSDGRPPRTAAIGLLVGGVLIILALQQMPRGLTIDQIPHVFLRVIAQAMN